MLGSVSYSSCFCELYSMNLSPFLNRLEADFQGAFDGLDFIPIGTKILGSDSLASLFLWVLSLGGVEHG